MVDTKRQAVGERLHGDGDSVGIGMALNPGESVVSLHPCLGDHSLVPNSGNGSEQGPVPFVGPPLHFLRAAGIVGVKVGRRELHKPALIGIRDEVVRIQTRLNEFCGLA